MFGSSELVLVLKRNLVNRALVRDPYSSIVEEKAGYKEKSGMAFVVQKSMEISFSPGVLDLHVW